MVFLLRIHIEMSDIAPGSPVYSLASSVHSVRPFVELDPLDLSQAEPALAVAAADAEVPAEKPRKQAKPRAPRKKAVAKDDQPALTAPTESEGSKVVRTKVAVGRAMEWSSAIGTWDQEFEAMGRLIPLGKLYLDLKREHGQARRINQDHVKTIRTTFSLRPPLGPVSCLVWNDGSMFTYIPSLLLVPSDDHFWLLGGQHLISAIKSDAAERDAGGLPLSDWHLHARCDVLRITCPVETRLLVSGQHNATSRLTRECTIFEVMEMVYTDKFTGSTQDLHSRIKRALEVAGINTKGDKAVCIFYSYHCSLVSSFITVGHHQTVDTTQLAGTPWGIKISRRIEDVQCKKPGHHHPFLQELVRHPEP